MRGVVRSKRDQLRSVRPGPRVLLACRLYASGAVATKRDAARAAGLHPAYLSKLNENEIANRIMTDTQAAIADKTVALSAVIQLMSRKALTRVDQLIDSDNEHVALKAATDILDRNIETSKTFKAQITSFSLDKEDVKDMAASLVLAARVKEQHRALAAGDFVKVEDLTDGKDEEVPSKKDHVEHHEAREADDSAPDDSGVEEG